MFESFVIDPFNQMVPVKGEVLEELGLANGQKVSFEMLIKITDINIARCEALIAIRKARAK